jgi:hypothetical protein
MKKKRYSAPTATRARVDLDEGFAGVSQRLSSSVNGKQAEWEEDEPLNESTGAGATYYAAW